MTPGFCFRRLLYLFAACAGLVGVGWLVPNDALRSGLGLVLMLFGLPFAVVCFIDWFESLKDRESHSRGCWWLARLASIPVLVLGLVSLVFGLTIFCWICYLRWTGEITDTNWTPWEPFGIAPALAGGGLAWISLAVRKNQVPDHGLARSEAG